MNQHPKNTKLISSTSYHKWLFFPNSREHAHQKELILLGNLTQNHSENRKIVSFLRHTHLDKENIVVNRHWRNLGPNQPLRLASHRPPIQPFRCCCAPGCFSMLLIQKGMGKRNGHRQLGEASSVLLAGFISQTSN